MTHVAWAQSTEAPFDALRSAYHTSIAERVRVVVQSTDAESASAGLDWSVDWSSQSPLIRIDLGRLQVEIADGVLAAVHRHNPKLVYRVPLDASDPASTLNEVLPPLPFPQVYWAISPNTHAVDLPPLLPGLIAVPRGTFNSSDPQTFEAPLGAGWTTRIVQRNDVTGGMASLDIDDQDGSTRLALSVTLLSAPLSRLSLQGREEVPSLQSLKAATAEIPAGSTLPTPGLMTRTFEPWSLSETLASAQSAGLAPIFAVLVIFDASRSSSIEDAAAAHRASTAAIQSLRRRAMFGELASAAFLLKPVALLSVDSFLEQPIATAHDRWRRAAGAQEDLVWSSAGPAFVSRLIP
ncbi:MAG: hypothetical protein PSX37_08950, partial [bacterium]|nr:hypothetical protein [bacterium]